MKKKGLIIAIVVVSLLLIGGIVYYLLGNKSNNNNTTRGDNNTPTNNDKPVNNSGEVVAKYDTEKFYLDRLTKNGYGFVKVYRDETLDVIQLNSIGEDQVIMSFDNSESGSNIWNEPFHMQVAGNKLNLEVIYATSNGTSSAWNNQNSRIFSINLDTLEAKKILDSDSFELTYDEYAISDKYLFLPRTQNVNSKMEYKIIRYDLKSLEKVVINNKIHANEIFVYKDILYLECSTDSLKNMDIKDSDKINSKEDYNYLTMDSDGKNIAAITKEEYNNIKKEANIHFEGFNTDSDMYFMKNNKKVYIENNKLLYDGKVIYTPKNNRMINFSYTDEANSVAITEYSEYESSEGDFKYFLVNVETNKVVEVEPEEVYEFVKVFTK